MKNSKLRRALLLVACAVLLVSVSVSATLAYLTSKTGVVNNTFTVGNVNITLDEGDVYDLEDQEAAANTENKITDEQLGLHKSADAMPRVQGNAYKLLPGKTYDKDPKVYVTAGSEDAYVFVKVVNTLAAANIEAANSEDTPNIAAQMTANGWTQIEANSDIWYYADRVSAGAELPVFASFSISDTADVSSPPANVTIQAYAVQAEGFASASAAYAEVPCTWGE